ncbi:MAG: hypothetical protein ACD_9C00004G0001 [uncultured bacterium]|nr:MAG: hypothetical protein ACD_9C00004G0001 [uncultured bacterium]
MGAMSGLKEMAAKVAENKWIGVVSGWGIWGTFSVYYDRIVFPALMLRFGNVLGGVYAALGAMLICTIFLVLYQLTNSSWVSSTDQVLEEIVSRIEKIEGYNVFGKIIFFIPRILLQASLRFIAKRGKLGFIALSCIADPFITILYYFKKEDKKGLGGKGWSLYLLSGLIANTYWIIWSSVIVVAIKFAWKIIQAVI